MGFDVAPCMIKESETPDEKRERIRQGLHEIRLLKLKEFSTPDLVRELCSRDNVSALQLAAGESCGEPRPRIHGPSLVIVVRGDE